MPFVITQFRLGLGVKTMQIQGFTPKEMDELGNMDYREFKEKVLEMVDERNKGTATVWHNGYGVYHVYTHPGYPDSIFVEIGTSCD